jgi:hypothetical protein
MATDRDALAAVLNDAGIAYSADFVPFSRSRNAKPKPMLKDLSLNWRITLTCGGRAFSTDYQAGIGHVPGYQYNARLTVDVAEAIRMACETGKAYKPGNTLFSRPIPAPDVADVLHCLISDAEADDCGSFEEWCSNVGADSDSIKDERIYRTCLDVGRRLRILIGQPTLNRLRDILADH